MRGPWPDMSSNPSKEQSKRNYEEKIRIATERLKEALEDRNIEEAEKQKRFIKRVQEVMDEL